MKLGPVVQEEMLFKEKSLHTTEGRTMGKDRSQKLTLSLSLRWANKKVINSIMHAYIHFKM